MLDNYYLILPCTKKSLITLQISVITGFLPLPQYMKALYSGELGIMKADVKGSFNMVHWSRSQEVMNGA